ncbi:hypothetical protein Tco_0179386 [Tanacetum coccineum]
MISGIDLHQFDVYNDGYFAHLPLTYVDGVILEIAVSRMPYEQLAEFLKEKCGCYFQGLYYQVPSQDLERGLVRVSDDRSTSYMFDVEETFGRLTLYLDHLYMNLSEYLSQVITYDMDDLVSKKIGPPKKRYCNDFSVDEMVDWAEMEVETKGVEARTSTTEGIKAKNSTTKGVEVRNSTTKDVEARTSTKDKGKENVSEVASDVTKAKAKDKPDEEMNEPNEENSMPADNVRGETFEEHDIYMNELLKSLKTADKDGITEDPFISVEKHVERYPMYDETTHWRLRKPKVGEKYTSVSQFKECLTYYALANGFLSFVGVDKDHLGCLIPKKGFIEAVKDVMPNAEHWQYARHIYKNFRKQYLSLEYRKLLWAASKSLYPQLFNKIMDKIKSVNPNAHKYLMDKNPKTWLRAFFEVDKGCEAIENGFSDCFNSVIVNVRHKPLLTMLEAIRRLEWLKEQQRFWHVIPAGGNLFEVRSGSEGFTIDEVKPVPGMNLWPDQSMYSTVLPPKPRKMSGRPKKKRIRAIGEGGSSTRVSKLGSQGSCSNCKKPRHNKSSCNEPVVEQTPKPKGVPGRGGAGGSRGGASGSIGRGAGGSGGASGLRGRGVAGSRGGASGSIGRGAGGSKRKHVSTAGTQKRQGKKKVGYSPGLAKWTTQLDQTKEPTVPVASTRTTTTSYIEDAKCKNPPKEVGKTRQ